MNKERLKELLELVAEGRRDRMGEMETMAKALLAEVEPVAADDKPTAKPKKK